MTEKKDIYRELAEMVDREDGVGVPVTPAFLKVLSLQFTPREARLALQIGLKGGTLEELSGKTGIEKDRLAKSLNTMADKGTMWIDPGKENPSCRVLGSAAPGLVETGIWGGIRYPYSVELGKALHEVIFEWTRDRLCKLGRPFAPVWAHPWALPEDAQPSENIAEFFKGQEYFSVSACPCRLSHWLAEPGDHCEHMLETCLHTGDTARWCVEHGQGREITYEDALQLLRDANADGLVHTININGFMCNCCKDCCPMFIGLRQLNTKTLIPTPFIPVIDEDTCNGCAKCEEACPTGAIKIEEAEDLAEVDADDCIGCGVCVAACAPASITLMRRPELVQPASLVDAKQPTAPAES